MTPRSPTPMSVSIVTGTVSRSPAASPAGPEARARIVAKRGSAVADPFSQPVVSSRSLEPVRPAWASSVEDRAGRAGFFHQSARPWPHDVGRPNSDALRIPNAPPEDDSRDL